MRRILEYHISRADEGKRVGDFLRGLGYSRHIVTHLKQTAGGILRNGEDVFTNQPLSRGDVLRVTLVEEEGSPQIVPVAMDLSIRYEDEDLLVIDKPANLPVHPSVNNHGNTLANGVMHYFFAQGLSCAFRCPNRLDRDTSGLLIVAKHMLSASLLSSMSASRRIRRVYLAVVEGILPASGTIDAPIARKDGSALMREVNFASGERAVTHYRRIAHDQSRSAALIRLETGRTHQIRVHMSYLGHPLLGDFLYNPASVGRPDCTIKRQALHSCLLSFPHPITGEELSFCAEPPPDLAALLGELGLPATCGTVPGA